MREIKCRGLTEALGKIRMVYGGHVYDKKQDASFIMTTDWALLRSARQYCITAQIQVDPKTIGLYIGCKDMNGTEIYEGDVSQSNDGLRRHVVAYDNKRARFYMKGLDGAWNIADPKWSHCEIIGNKHQHAHLLEQQT